MNGVEVELVVTVLVGGFALAVLRDAWRALHGGRRLTPHWLDASRSDGCRGRRACGSQL